MVMASKHLKRKMKKRFLSLTAFTLAEMVVVVVMVGLFVMMANVRLLGLLRKSTFKGQVHEFVLALERAA